MLMAFSEIYLVYLPLCVLLIGITIYELKTGLIIDLVTLPATLYFLAARAITGPDPWWHYPLTTVSILVLFMLFGWFVPQLLFGHDLMGGGGIKLMVAISAALGLALSIQFTMIFIILTALCMLGVRLLRRQALPSSILALLSLILLIVYRNL